MAASIDNQTQQQTDVPRPVDNGYLHSAPEASSSTSPLSTSAPELSTHPHKPRRINPSQFSFTPMRQLPPKSPLSQTVANASGSGSNSSSGHNTPVGGNGSAMSNKPAKKVHIAHPPHSVQQQALVDDDDDTPPCFIHSGLDKHGSLQDWLRQKGDHFLPHPHKKNREREPAALQRSRKHHSVPPVTEQPPPQPKPAASSARNGMGLTLAPNSGENAIQTSPESDEPTPRPFPSNPSLREMRDKVNDYYDEVASVDSTPPDDAVEFDDDDDDDTQSSNLTRQLAATAQGVREVSKELGRTTVHSRIQHILIVTKARDNGLIRLTRQLALYMMLRELPFIPSSAASSMTDLSRTSDTRSERGYGGNRRVVVYVDAQLRNSKRFDAAGMERDYPHLFEPVLRRRSNSASASSVSLSTMASSWGTNGYTPQERRPREDGQLRYWTADMCSNSPQLFDFVVTLGGDGTVLFTSWLFQKIVPPVLPFALGSLGFLTNFDFKNYKETMDRVIDEGIRVNLRMRFTATVYRAIAPEESLVIKRHGKRKAIRRPGGNILVQQVDRDGWESLEGGVDTPKHTSGKDKEIMCFTTRPVEQFEVLNDLVVDRGPSPFVSLLEVFGDDHHLTTVQADGLTVSTPTGSTAYSLSAGGSLVHPQIPALLLTPICPHTLSFRPMLLPDSMELRVCVPYNSRSTAWASFDGRGRIELKQGDHIKITASKYPFPTVCADKQSTDWFRSISRTLRWNERERQKSFVVVEEDGDPDEKHGDSDGEHSGDEVTYCSEESEVSEEEFDIDDRSGGETPSPPGAIPIPQAAPSSSARIRSLMDDSRDDSKSGVQSPDRFAAGYRAPPPVSQRHLLEKLATVESQLRQASLDGQSENDMAARYAQLEADEEHDDLTSLPDDSGPGFARCESDATLGGNEYLEPSYDGGLTRNSRSDSVITLGSSRTPRQGRSRSRSRHRTATAPRSRSGSPAVGPSSRPKAFAFFGHDDSTSELSDDHSF